MDLTLEPSEQAFRDELRAWLEMNNPGPGPEGPDQQFEFRREWQHKLQEQRFAGLSWPPEFGGRGATLMEQAIFGEEITRARAPMPANVLGLVMGGPVVIAHGNAEQKARFLEPILNASEIWCQGFSEPDAGSDLASLKTRAVKVDGGWKVTGQKVWTSLAQYAKWMMLLARTDPDAPKHNGLSYMILDMKQPGVQVRPLRQITGESEFNEVFIEDAFVPDENLIGEVGQGWSVGITTLMFERAGIALASAMTIKQELGELATLIRERGMDADSVIRQRFGALVVHAETMRLNSYRGLSQAIRTGIPGPEGSMAKIQWADINQGLTELAMDVKGADAPLADPVWGYRLLRARANSIEGGTSEIQRNILAERVLGLPKLR
ncbi:MAG TPA: acyl-CoA dehydrogenase family protein [Candidatus Dormibacteraeota bacterium]|nr:acyl-CoA dehydrogenase family protein [Candidatus Dormibacteraeota bacterium]